MQRTKKQHLVPQFYLRNFTSSPNVAHSDMRIWVYDKQQGVSRQSHIKDVAQQNRYYDIPDDLVIRTKARHPDFDADPQLIEHAFAGYEDKWKRYFDILIRDIHKYRLRNEDKEVLANYFIRQFLRTRVSRDLMNEMLVNLITEIAKTYITAKLPDAKPEDLDFSVNISDNWLRVNHARMLFNPEVLKPLCSRLQTFVWLIGENRSASTFYTSDNPIVMRANGPVDSQRSLYFHTPGVEVILPITPRYAIVALERSYSKTILKKNRTRDGSTFALDNDTVSAYNILQVASSRLQIYCDNNDFEIASQICNLHPEFKDPNRDRSKIISGLNENIFGVIRT